MVYRVERVDGQGPYNAVGYAQIHGGYPNYGQHPMPYDDGIQSVPHEWQFGFACLPDLERWFSPAARAKLHAHGYRLSVYEPTRGRVKLGYAQVCFDRERARLVRSFGLNECSTEATI